MSATALLTFAQFEQLPDAPGKRELIEGELVEMPPPLDSHTLTAQAILFLLGKVVGESRVRMEGGYKIGGNWVQPDVSLTRPDQPREGGYLAGAPMPAVEILSEHKSAQAVEAKLDLYFDNRAKEVWTVSRRRVSITVYRQDEAGTRTSIRITDEYTPKWLGVAVRPAELIVP